ncbi:MAG: RNA 2',3'-cyclic phosphodiesterase [Alphaproteobacteria bacterium]|nr:RNA 2',3'-cyclic phosphodiesterase [Alphaproteobacteria bacterium]
MPRLFIAIQPPDDVRDRVATLCSGLKGVRWVTPENLHLTLKFIGERPAHDVPDMISALGRIHLAPFQMTLSGVGYFGARKRIRSIWAGVERTEALVNLHRRVESTLHQIGIPREDRKFAPHITLARLKNGRPERLGPWIEANNLFRADPFQVAQFQLFTSFLSQEGAIYHPEAEFPLENR